MRKTGLMLVLTAMATVVAVVGRVSADPDQPTLAASLAAIAESRGLYGLGGAGRLLSGVTLMAAGWFLFGSASDGRRERAAAIPLLFAVSGAFTVYSGGSAVAVAAIVPDGLDAAGLETLASRQESTMWLRWFTGSFGFALAGIALIGVALRQWSAGGSLKWIAPASALLGAAIQLIWFDAATSMHRITGTLFLVWLAAGGCLLLAGRAWIPD